MENQQLSDQISDKIHGYLDDSKSDERDKKAAKRSLLRKMIETAKSQKNEEKVNETKFQETQSQDFPETSDMSDKVTFESNEMGEVDGIPLDKMTPEIANTLHSIEARRSGGIIQTGGLAAQAQSAAARNITKGLKTDIPPDEVLGAVPKDKMTPEIASTLQSLEARRHGGVVEPGSLASQALSAASRNVIQGSGENLGGIPVERITPELASILQSIEARRSGGFLEPGGLAAQAQSIARRNLNQGLVHENTILRLEELDLSQIVPEMASALQSLEARHTGGYVEPGGLASQALSASRRNSIDGQSGTGSRRNSISGQVNEVGGLPLDKMTPEIANTLHSIEARRSGGVIESGGPAALAQSAAARNIARGLVPPNVDLLPEDVLGSIPMDKMTPEIASALQSLEARRNGGFVQPGGLASKARSAAQRNLNKSQGTSPQNSRRNSQTSTGRLITDQPQSEEKVSQGGSGRQRTRVMWIPKTPDQDTRKLDQNLEQLQVKDDQVYQNQEPVQMQGMPTGKLE